jgi:RNA polymerase sigma-70 factor (ECF subfamily)
MSSRKCVHAGSAQELVEGLLRREERAWCEMHKRYGRLIARCIHDVLRPFSARLPSDATHEVYATFLLSLNQREMHKLRAFDAEKGRTFSSWLGHLATHCAVDYVRKHARWHPVGLENAPIELVPDAHRMLVDRMRLDVVRRAARELSARDRQLLGLVFDEALEPDAIAARMGVSIKTVYSKSHKIREKLRRALVVADLAEAA